ncbi:hypothetical protein BDW67DRAFT_154271 [Aspergillus spinulosporus]
MPRALLIFRWKGYWGRIRNGRLAMAYLCSCLPACSPQSMRLPCLAMPISMSCGQCVIAGRSFCSSRVSMQHPASARARTGLGQTLSFVTLSLLGLYTC